jgi:protein-tyrosine phosphatase
MIDFDQILPNLYVGSCPKSLDDILLLKERIRVTAVLNLQTDEDLRQWSIHWPAMETFYNEAGIRVERAPMRDFDPEHQRECLPQAVGILAELLTSGAVIYLHCTAGAGRSPLVAMAYLYWYGRMDRDEAIHHVHERRFCAPYEDLLLSVPTDQESINKAKNPGE